MFCECRIQAFLECNGIRHITSAPYHPASNGFAERAVQVVKSGLKKMREGTIGDQLARFLFSYRTTPHTTTGVTPAELLFGRNLQTQFHKLYPDRRSVVEEHQASQKRWHDQHVKQREFQLGDRVYVRNFSHQGPKWLAANISERTGPISFKVTLDSNHLVHRRHIDYIRPRYDADIRASSPSDPSIPLDSESGGEDTAEEVPGGLAVQQEGTNSQGLPQMPSTLGARAKSPVPDVRSTERRYPLRDRRPPDRLQF